MLINFQNEQVRLLELFSSTHYFGAMRDRWEEMIKHTEFCLESYMNRLPLNYRSKPLPDQPDIAWGHRVLPNFRYTLEQLNKAYIMLTHGDISALGYADNVRSDFKGQLDYQPDWMSETDAKTYEDNIFAAVEMAHRISLTESGAWQCLENSKHLEELTRFSALPRSYRINPNVFVRSGEKTTIAGIYKSDLEPTCPQFLSTSYKRAPLTSVLVGTEDLIDPITGEKYDEQKVFKETECTWYLIEISEDHHNLDAPMVNESRSLRIEGGQPCPKTGYYFTPAHANSRKHFDQGELMPSLSSTYGQTIWQWDEVQ